MNDVFISYSRKDKAFVQTLHAALKQTGCDAWVDWEDIPLTADWWHEIQRGIEQAHSFIFVISPDSVASTVCRQEIEHALQHHKRLIPILRRDGFAMDQIHDQIAKHNWIFFQPDHDFETAFQSLSQAIQTDLEHVNDHTRLLVRALEWETKGRDDSFLLRGQDLDDAEQWLERSADKTPRPVEQQINFVHKSREAEDAHCRLIEAGEKAKRMVRVGSAILAVTLGAATLVGMMTAQALRQLNEATTATRLERDGLNAIKQFESDQLGALLSAVQSTAALEMLMGGDRPLADYPTTSPLFALRSILENIQEPNRLRADTSNASSARFSPDGRYIATVGDRGLAHLWNRSGELITEFKGHEGQVLDVIFTPQGDRLITTGRDGTARLWDLTGNLLVTFEGHRGRVWSASLSPDGTTMVTGGEDGVVRLWSLDGVLRREWKGHEGWIGCVRFSPEGQSVVTTGQDGITRLWSLDGTQRFSYQGHQGSVNEVAISPDGQ